MSTLILQSQLFSRRGPEKKQQPACGRLNVTAAYEQRLCLDEIKECEGATHWGKKRKTHIEGTNASARKRVTLNKSIPNPAEVSEFTFF